MTRYIPAQEPLHNTLYKNISIPLVKLIRNLSHALAQEEAMGETTPSLYLNIQKIKTEPNSN